MIHRIMEAFQDGPATAARLREIAAAVLASEVPWAAERALWAARIGRIADWFVAGEIRRREEAQPLAPEAEGRMTLPSGTEIVARADRIDRFPDGALRVIDYKTGTPPTPPQIVDFDRQILLMAAMAEAGCFAGVPAGPVISAVHIGLGTTPADDPLTLRTPFTRSGREILLDPDESMRALEALLAEYADPSKGYAARRQPYREADAGDYDHLARFGEWDATAPSLTMVLG